MNFRDSVILLSLALALEMAAPPMSQDVGDTLSDVVEEHTPSDSWAPPTRNRNFVLLVI